MKFYEKSVGSFTITDRDYLTSGGENDIYRKKNKIYAIAQDPSRVIDPAKIKELAVLDHPHIIRPMNLILNQDKKTPAGHSMRFVNNAKELCVLFTKDFRDRNNITPASMLTLVEKFRDLIAFIHDKNCLVVDLNDMNFLTDLVNIYAIDVPTYKTPNFPPTALMENVRDRHTKDFNEGSDWFSWAVVSFQMFMGVHPYKGKNPDYKKIANHLPKDERTAFTLNKRMEDSVSVFHEGSTYRKLFPLENIPKSLRAWYEQVFEKNLRCPPPADFDKIEVFVTVEKIKDGNIVSSKLILEYDDPVVAVYPGIVVTSNDIFLNNIKTNVSLPSSKFCFARTESNQNIMASMANEKIVLTDLGTHHILDTDINVDDIMSVDDRIYARQGSVVHELSFMRINDKTHVGFNPVAQVMENATLMFDGGLIQNMLGNCILSTFPEKGVSYQLNLTELKGHRIISARMSKNVLVVAAFNNKTRKHARFVFRTDKDKYDLNIYPDSSSTNFTVTHKGVIILFKDDVIELSSSRVGSAGRKEIPESGQLNESIMITSIENEIIGIDDKKVCRISMS